MLKDVGVTSGFVGCIESIHINSSQTSVNFDLSDDSSHSVLHRVNIGQLINNILSDSYVVAVDVL